MSETSLSGQRDSFYYSKIIKKRKERVIVQPTTSNFFYSAEDKILESQASLREKDFLPPLSFPPFFITQRRWMKILSFFHRIEKISILPIT